ncbi:MAG: hypothetical protein U1E64_13435 [Sphingomonadaceae bacterium]
MTRILRYILQHDSGMAPCIDHGLVSLATCKPKIRASAKPGEWVVGFRPSPAPRGLVVWAGQVATNTSVGEYERLHSCKRRGGRADAVYRELPNGGFERLRPHYHPGPDEFRKDTTAPVLIFDPKTTWYFGQEPQMMPEHLMHLAAGGRGHRVNGMREGDATALHSWLASVAPPGVHHSPRDGVPKKPRRC